MGRLVAVAILVGMLAVLYLGIAAPALEFYRDREATLATELRLDRRLRAVAAEVPRLQASAAELRKAQNTRAITVDGANDALASASLQSLVEGAALSAGVTIASTDGVPAEAREDYRRIGLRVSVAGTYEHIVEFLAAIEKMRPPLVLGSLQIHGKPIVSASQEITQLDAGLSVYGFRRIGSLVDKKP